MAKFNDNPYDIKLIYKYSLKVIDFLGISIQVDKEGILRTDTVYSEEALQWILCFSEIPRTLHI